MGIWNLLSYNACNAYQYFILLNISQVSLLLSQYHELLTQTLDDKEHFHEEEKVYTDKMNNLYRQKEKLEEKIMEQYKKMENTPPKK